MRIGIDGRELAGRRTGVGRYLANLCAEWTGAPACAGHRLIVYTPRPLASEMLPPAGAGADLCSTVVPGTGGVWWEQRSLARRAADDRLDVFFGPGYSVPLALDAPSVVTLHDVSFTARPEWFGWREGLRRRWLAARAAAAAQTVIAVSAFSRREILRLFGAPPARVRVVHNGAAPPADPDAAETPLPLPVLPASVAAGTPLVLYAGALFNRRRLPLLIRALAHAARAVPGVQLVIVGPDRTRPAEDLRGIAEACGVEARVTLLSYVDDATLAALYRRATVFAWLSEYEGFGLTPLEALAAGTPVVAADTPVAREIYGDAVRPVPVGDPRATAAALVEIITRADLRAALLARARPLLARYTWARAAAETFDVLRDAAARRP